jgi:hypothetical protein
MGLLLQNVKSNLIESRQLFLPPSQLMSILATADFDWRWEYADDFAASLGQPAAAEPIHLHDNQVSVRRLDEASA